MDKLEEALGSTDAEMDAERDRADFMAFLKMVREAITGEDDIIILGSPEEELYDRFILAADEARHLTPEVIPGLSETWCYGLTLAKRGLPSEIFDRLREALIASRSRAEVS